MTRKMQSEDLGDLHLYEDEAIREQAARLQIHVSNLSGKIDQAESLSYRTVLRLKAVEKIVMDARHTAEALCPPQEQA